MVEPAHVTSILTSDWSRVSPSPQFGPDVTQLVDTKLNDCSLICLVNFDRDHICSNTQVTGRGRR